MKEYEAIGHMSIVKLISNPYYLISHRKVLHLYSPLCDVFNASSSIKSASSLNYTLITETNIQRE